MTRWITGVFVALWVMAVGTRAHADPVAVAEVGASGLALTVTAFVQGTPPGCTVPARVDAINTWRVLARDDTAGWALVRTSSRDASLHGRTVAIETPILGQPVTITWGTSPSAAVTAYMGRATSTAIELRLLQPAVGVPEGAAVVDSLGALLGVVSSVESLRVTVVPAVLALAEIRDAAVHSPASCRLDTSRSGLQPAQRGDDERCPAPLPSTLDRLLSGRADAAVVRDGSVTLGVAVLGDGLMVAPATTIPRAERACTGWLRAGGSVRGQLVSVDATTGLALVRTDRRDPVGLPFGAVPQPCARVTVIRGDAATDLGAVVRDIRAGEMRVDVENHAHGLGVGDVGAPVVDAGGALVGMVSRVEGNEALVSLVDALPQRVALVATAGLPPACAETATEEVPALGTEDIAPLGDPLGTLTVHVGTDNVYATVGDRMSEVAVGCIVRRAGYPDNEVLDVDPVNNIGIFHPLERFQGQLPWTIRGEAPPLRLVDARPEDGTAVTVTTAPGASVQARVVSGMGDELIVSVTGEIPRGAPVTDSAGRLVGLTDRPLGNHRTLVRSASILRRMLVRLRRNDGTPACSGAYGMIPGPVVAFNALMGVRISTPAGAAVHFPLAVGVLWYNTWWARGELGFALPNDAISLVAAGGPLLFRSAGDGEVGFGAHLEFEIPTFAGQNDVADPRAVRALYGMEVQASPYVSNSVGLMFSLALGLSQHGDYTQDHFGFGGTFMLGFTFGTLRHDRP